MSVPCAKHLYFKRKNKHCEGKEILMPTQKKNCQSHTKKASTSNNNNKKK